MRSTVSDDKKRESDSAESHGDFLDEIIRRAGEDGVEASDQTDGSVLENEIIIDRRLIVGENNGVNDANNTRHNIGLPPLVRGRLKQKDNLRTNVENGVSGENNESKKLKEGVDIDEKKDVKNTGDDENRRTKESVDISNEKGNEENNGGRDGGAKKSGVVDGNLVGMVDMKKIVPGKGEAKETNVEAQEGDFDGDFDKPLKPTNNKEIAEAVVENGHDGVNIVNIEEDKTNKNIKEAGMDVAEIDSDEDNDASQNNAQRIAEIKESLDPDEDNDNNNVDNDQNPQSSTPQNIKEVGEYKIEGGYDAKNENNIDSGGREKQGEGRAEFIPTGKTVEKEPVKVQKITDDGVPQGHGPIPEATNGDGKQAPETSMVSAPKPKEGRGGFWGRFFRRGTASESGKTNYQDAIELSNFREPSSGEVARIISMKREQK